MLTLKSRGNWGSPCPNRDQSRLQLPIIPLWHDRDAECSCDLGDIGYPRRQLVTEKFTVECGINRW